MKKTVIALFSVFILAIGLTALAAYLVRDFTTRPASTQNEEVIYEVTLGKGFNGIAKELQGLGVVTNAEFFTYYARFTGQRSQLKVGEYQLNKNMNPQEVLAVITSGHSIAKPFTVSEGLNIFEIADLYESSGFGKAEEFLKLARDPAFVKSLLGQEADSLEGYLFPETYQITKFSTTRELLVSMVRRFLTVYKEIEPLAKNSKMSRHQIVTLASIIEKETGANSERGLVSSIFHNRLIKGMRLQTDPTILYGMAFETGKMPTKIGRSDILRPTRYNTYVINSLPPGPISNPGREALLATLKPTLSEYLYFVSRNDGTHVFSKNYEDHNKAVRQFQLDPKAREGKSWRDLSKKPEPPSVK